MSKRANPALIGGFIIGGTLLAIVAVGFVASGSLFSSYSTYVSYFTEPVNGLSVGAPVKYRGILLGQVDQIGLLTAERGNDLAEVQFRIEDQRLLDLGALEQNITDENMAKLVREGLRSRLEVESIVTGVVYITLEFKDDVGPPNLRNPDSRYVEVPTGLSPMSELTASAGEVIARLAKIDVTTLSENLVNLTATLDRKMNQLDMQQLSENLALASERMSVLMANPALPQILAGVDSAITEFRLTNGVLVDLLSDVSPSLARTDSILVNLNTALSELAEATDNTGEMLAEDAKFRMGLEGALSETALTMKSLRRLTDMLERNPRAMVAGKSGDRK